MRGCLAHGRLSSLASRTPAASLSQHGRPQPASHTTSSSQLRPRTTLSSKNLKQNPSGRDASVKWAVSTLRRAIQIRLTASPRKTFSRKRHTFHFFRFLLHTHSVLKAHTHLMGIWNLLKPRTQTIVLKRASLSGWLELSCAINCHLSVCSLSSDASRNTGPGLRGPYVEFDLVLKNIHAPLQEHFPQTEFPISASAGCPKVSSTHFSTSLRISPRVSSSPVFQTHILCRNSRNMSTQDLTEPAPFEICLATRQAFLKLLRETCHLSLPTWSPINRCV